MGPFPAASAVRLVELFLFEPTAEPVKGEPLYTAPDQESESSSS
jgi:hypothetical protein